MVRALRSALARLVRARQPLALLGKYLVSGVLLFAGLRLISGQREHHRALVVDVPNDATHATVERAIDEAVLLDIAERAGWPRSDAVVRERMLSVMGVVPGFEGLTPAALIDEGLGARLYCQDTVARDRLLTSARRALSGTAQPKAITRSEIEAHIAQHEDLYRQPARVRLAQVFLARDRRGASIDADMAAVEAALDARPAGADACADPPGASDPWPWFDGEEVVSVARVEALIGSGSGRAVEQAPLEQWIGPHRSRLGVHFFCVSEREPSRLPSADEVGSRARMAIDAERAETAATARLAELRARYAITVRRAP
ncbi:MAG: peptidylprolyl isomerase [Polyangiaceae bacterium]